MAHVAVHKLGEECFDTKEAEAGYVTNLLIIYKLYSRAHFFLNRGM
jgi:hypothetical protein